MKILLLTVSAGEGHNAMSRALELYVKSQTDKQVEVAIYDLFKANSRVKNWIVNDLYFGICKLNIKIANRFYQNQKKNKKTEKTIVHKITNNMRQYLIEKIDAFQPDVVFCAHTYAGIIMSDFKKEGRYTMPVVSVVSDFDISPYTQCITAVDYMIIPEPSFERSLQKLGFKKEQIKCLGIPVQTKFSDNKDKIEARIELGIDPSKFTIMIMNGGFGFGNNELLVRNISQVKRDFQIVVVNGKNELMRTKIQKFLDDNNISNVFNLGFVNNVDTIMSASDILVGKIGGVAISEAFNKHLPIIASKKLPWQEHDNMLFLKARNACEYIRYDEHIIELITNFIDHPETLENMREEMARIAKPNATVDIGNLLIELAENHIKNK